MMEQIRVPSLVLVTNNLFLKKQEKSKIVTLKYVIHDMSNFFSLVCSMATFFFLQSLFDRHITKEILLNALCNISIVET